MRVLILLCSMAVLAACQTAQEHARAVNEAQQADDRITVGKVQRSISVGMSGAEVIDVLGSPNIVSTDTERREVWVYDKVSTSRVYSASRGGINTLFLGAGLAGSTALGGGAAAGVSSGAGAQSTSQRTLTVVIKYDSDGLVRDFAYRSSSF